MIPVAAALLTPFVKDLFANGLNLLGNAVMSKGKEYVEEKLGTKLPSGDMVPPEKLAELRSLEFKHEETLQQLAIRRAELDLDEFKATLADVESARKREIEIAVSQHAPLLNKIISPILALVVVVGGGVLLAFGDPDVRTASAGLISAVLGYYFGTSVGSREKQQMIERLTK